MSIVACSVDGCECAAKARSLCNKHYEYLRGRGELPPKPCKGCGADLAGTKKYCSDACIPKCSVDDCGDVATARGWCVFHYTRWKLTGNPVTPITKTKYQAGQECSHEGCLLTARKAGLCDSHYHQLRTAGELTQLAHKSKATTCAFCGGPSGIRAGYRRVCSPACSRMFNRHGGPLPETFKCGICGDNFRFVVEGQRRKKHNTKTCVPCQRASMKHGYSPKQLAKRDGNDCKLCGDPVDMTLGHPSLMRGSVDHIIPSSLGGSNEPDNVQLAHLHCNIKKNNRVVIAA